MEGLRRYLKYQDLKKRADGADYSLRWVMYPDTFLHPEKRNWQNLWVFTGKSSKTENTNPSALSAQIQEDDSDEEKRLKEKYAREVAGGSAGMGYTAWKERELTEKKEREGKSV